MPTEGAHGTRRRLLRTAGAAAVAGIVGCAGRSTGGVETGETTAPADTEPSGSDDDRSTTIAILAAGSLQHALEGRLEPSVDVPVRVEAHGSATVARMIDEGQRDPDIVTVADVALFEDPLAPPWYSVFTSNSIVIAYNPDTAGGERLAAAGPEAWYEPMARDDVSVGRTDPDLDPLGYRTLFALELASRYYDDASNLEDQILRRDQIYPETSLISQFETGSIDAAFAYRNMAVERDYAYITLPDQINLSNPRYTDEWYSTVSYTLSSGQPIRGGLISYGSTIRRVTDATLAVFDVHTTGSYLEESGFLLRDRFPRYEGDPPSRLTDATSPSPTSASRTALPDRSLAGTVSDITVLV